MLLAEELHEDKNLQIDLLDIQVAKNRYHQTIEYIEAIECSVQSPLFTRQAIPIRSCIFETTACLHLRCS